MAPEHDDWDQHWHDYSGAVEENPAQTYRRRLIAAHLGLAGSSPRVLDIGSGPGDLIAELKEGCPGGRFLGVELSQAGVEIARRKVPDATFLQQDLLGDVSPDDVFRSWATHAVCSEVLEHVDQPEKLLWNARAFMQPGCRLVVTVPGGPRSAFDRHIGHRRHFSIEDLRQLLERAGLAVEMVTGAGFPFFNLYRLVVVARGRRLIDDVALSADGDSASRLARLVMGGFGRLFRFNVDRSRFGYQLVAVAREPA